MPNRVMLSNKTAFKKGAERAYWKLMRTLDFLDTDPEFKNISASDFDYDRKDLVTLITMFVDIKDYMGKSESERYEYFKEEARKIANAFLLTRDENNPRMPDFKAVEPYIRRMYNEVKLDNNIDWDNENEIDALCCSANSQQALATIANSFAVQLGKVLTVEEKRRIDSNCLKASANQYIFKNKVIREELEVAQNMKWGSVDMGNRQYFVEQEVAIAIAEASKDNKQVVFDPGASEVAKKYFLGEEFEMEQTGEVYIDSTYNHMEAASNYLDSFKDIIGKACFDSSLMGAIKDEDYETGELLMINGEPVSKLLEEEMKRGATVSRASENVGMMLRRAMTDGHSVVTMMRPMLNGDGKVSFWHQELKVDLDKLNKIDRTEHYSIFRRALDVLGFFKIPPLCVSNKDRDKAQASKMADSKFRDALRKAEDKFIAQYNKKAGRPDRTGVLKAYPKVSRLENITDREHELNNTIKNDHRQPLGIDPNATNIDRQTEVKPKNEEPVMNTRANKEL